MTSRKSIFLNPHVNPQYHPACNSDASIRNFHASLPNYAITPLISLPNVAQELNLGSVNVKDESLRLGLPAFKILGASWAVYRAVYKLICENSQQPSIALNELGELAREHGVDLVTCTDGNWGRGVARMAQYLGIMARIFVPNTMDEETKERIRSEGAQVEVADGDYDVSIQAARSEAEKGGGLLVMDVAWEGYEQVPEWVVQGYSTMLMEMDEQLEEQLGKGGSEKIDLAIASVGVGSFAQAVTMHFKGKAQGTTKVVAVEPVTAACLQRSLKEGKVISIETEDTIMCGMNCGTVSTTAWPFLRDGIDAAVMVQDGETHKALLAMKQGGMHPGPCGAAPLAALRKVCHEGPFNVGPESNVVLFCTEGMRPYMVPD